MYAYNYIVEFTMSNTLIVHNVNQNKFTVKIFVGCTNNGRCIEVSATNKLVVKVFIQGLATQCHS